MVDEATELQLALLALDWLLFLGLCAFHTGTGELRKHYAEPRKNKRKDAINKRQGYAVSNSTPKYWSIKFFFVEAEAAPLSDSV